MTGPGIGNVLEAIKTVRVAAPHILLAWGSYHATLAFRGISREGLVDIVVRGPDEATSVALADSADSGTGFTPGALAGIPNPAFSDGRMDISSGTSRRRVTTTGCGFAIDPRSLPPTDYTLLPVTDYCTAAVRDLSYNISSFGCPHPCTFCSEPQTSLRRWKAFLAKRVVDEDSNLWDTYKPDQITLLDPNFSTNIQRVVNVVELLEQRGLYIQLRADMRTTDAD
ncbi:hypothetical protein [Streptomyces sp. YGL11-2]|uniref:hypothetical protein n=1 Tax=Streptomyces sp. YGL11-2 TaxID=3414028 RepID=UPI003CF49038